MQHELHTIESLLKTVVREISRDHLTDDYLQGVKKRMAVEEERIKLVFDEKLILDEPSPTTLSYVALHQKILVKLLDTAHEHGIVSNVVLERKMVLALISDTLEKLLTYIKTDFSLYFNNRQKVPKHFVATWLVRIANNLLALEAKYSNAAGNRDLIDIALCPFRSLNFDMTEFSYGQLEYYDFLQRRLLSLDTFVDDQTILRQDVCKCLIGANYNCSLFFKYYTDQVHRILVTSETLSDRIDHASYFYKVVGQIQIETKLAFELSSLNLKEQVLEWLSLELNYLQDKRKLQFSCLSQADVLRKDFKVIFNLSVSQLAFLIRTFVETGVIQNKNTSELIRFTAKFVKTKKAEAISFDSFRTKFYNIETGTKDAAKKMVQSMLQYWNRN